MKLACVAVRDELFGPCAIESDIACDRERKWKIQQGKRFVRAVARSNLDIESRAVVRQKEAELAIRRKAAWIAKEVCMPAGDFTKVACHQRISNAVHLASRAHTVSVTQMSARQPGGPRQTSHCTFAVPSTFYPRFASAVKAISGSASAVN